MSRTIAELEELALWTRRKVLDMAVKADSGHVSTACSQTEILIALYFGGILKYDSSNPKWSERDVFLLSKGQGGIGLYPILARAGFFPESDLDNFCGRGSKIGVHAEWHCPGVEMLSGSLGHGLPVATGICAAFKADDKPNLVYCMVGDGELHEGSNWEAMLTASHQKMDNLVLIVDRNGQNTIGRTRPPFDNPKDGPDLDPLQDKLEAFGFQVWVVNGHNLVELDHTFKCVKKSHRDHTRPLAIICNTEKGHGLSVMAGARDWHYRVPRGAELTQCQSDLALPHWQPPEHPEAKHGVAMRDRFFDALYEHFKRCKDYVLITADNGWPGIDKFAALDGQFYQCGIAEQTAVGMASGLAMQGKRVYCYAIGCFLSTRIHEFAKLDLCAMNTNVTLVAPGAGFSYDLMGPTHMNVDDLAIMRVLPNMRVYGPADGTTSVALADITATMDGPSYIRLDRGGVKDLYTEHSVDWSRGLVGIPCGTVDDADKPQLTFVATGIMVHQALKAAAELKEFDVKVIDVFRISPLPERDLFEELSGSDFVVTLEEHQLNGGLGGAFAEFQADWFCGCARKHLRLAVPNKFTFALGGRQAVWEENLLDIPIVISRIRKWALNENS